MVVITATLPNGGSDSIEVDTILVEAPTRKATITESPVEQGSDVTDHIRQQSENLRLELIVTNTPSGGAVASRAEGVYTKLNTWQGAGAILSMMLTIGFRQNMAIDTVGTVRDAKTGGDPSGNWTEGTGPGTAGLKITLALKEIRFVQNAFTAVVKSTDPRVAPSVSTGNTTPTPSDQAETGPIEKGLDSVGLGGAKGSPLSKIPGLN